MTTFCTSGRVGARARAYIRIKLKYTLQSTSQAEKKIVISYQQNVIAKRTHHQNQSEKNTTNDERLLP